MTCQHWRKPRARFPGARTPVRRAILTGAGGVAAAVLGSLCCAGPLLFVTFGVGLGLASTFEPLRPFFGVLMLVLLAAGFWTVYGRSMRRSPGSSSGRACATGAGSTAPTRRTREVVILWVATLVALVAWTFPTWSAWLT